MTIRSALVPVLAVALAILVGGWIIALSGSSPLDAYKALIEGSLSDSKGIGRTLEKATPLVLGGLAVAFAFKAGLFNIGGQGQLVIGAIFAGAIGYGVSGLPWIIHTPLALLVGALAGAEEEDDEIEEDIEDEDTEGESEADDASDSTEQDQKEEQGQSEGDSGEETPKDD